MEKLYKKSLFIFRRDLRLEDNTALNAALSASSQVIACFNFDPRQYDDKSYFSPNSFRFLLDSLRELGDEVQKAGGRLYIFNGVPEDSVSALIKTENIEAVYFNRDYTPFARKRDKTMHDTCVKHKITAHQYADCLLNEPEAAVKDDGRPYTIFTPFFKKNSQRPVKAASKLGGYNFYKENIKLEDRKILNDLRSGYSQVETLFGGREAGLKILAAMKEYREYQTERDYPIQDATTHLSAHNKFGTLSIREVYHCMVKLLGASHALVRQLYWRDFFTHIAFHFPHVFKGAFNKKYDAIEWENSQKKFKAWCNAQTGFPVVDAAMREINTTGFMHNRARMIVASFLVKDLHIDWRWGEKYFAAKLVDYDPAVNNGSWQWAASTGCDAQPYFRIFNPWLQQQKFDAQCLYIKKWLPELKDVAPKVLHNLFKNKQSFPGYPTPIVHHAEASSVAKEMFGEM